MKNRTMLVLLTVAYVLTGCKVEISVPEGGSVMSSSGLYGCSSGEVCTIDVNHSYFMEEFTAISMAGYEFAGWGKHPGGFCGGQNSPCKLSTTSFQHYPGLMAFLNTDNVFTMSPVFLKNSIVTPQPISIWKVRSNQVTVNYLVGGDTTSEWKREMQKMHTNWEMQGMPGMQGAQRVQRMSAVQKMMGIQGSASPGGIRSDSDSEVYGKAEWSYAYHYSYVADAGKTNCQVVSGEIDFDFETALPQLSNLDDISVDMRGRWMPYQAGLTAHEASHQEIFRRLMSEVPAAMRRVGVVACSDLGVRLQRAANAASILVQQVSEDFDVETNHGGYTTPPL